MKLDVFILNYNGEDIISKAIDAVLLQTIECRIIVIDNGSCDNSLEIINAHVGVSQLVSIRKNISFTSAYNIAFKNYRESQYFFIMSNDVFLESRDLLEFALKRLMNDPQIGLFAPRSNRMDGGLDYIAKPLYRYSQLINSFALPIKIPKLRQKFADQYSEFYPEVLQDSALLINNKYLNDGEIFDEKMAFYFTEDDLSATVRRNGGKLLYCPDVSVNHLVSYSTERKSMSWSYRKLYADSVAYCAKYYGWISGLIYILMSLPYFLLKYLRYKFLN